ncbi:hypothetical protein pdam_00023741 [Pocillopora damicornis]|uniref:Uncharacterized protein n=1 Tax=Pocillopora damicornis TaxID=46731 RepID=A0A3M6UJS1_POCDA|nr:hypothetical protein pdam_00023741 [Pocillopora damicornis]
MEMLKNVEEEREEIRYIDVTSEYPNVNKYGSICVSFSSSFPGLRFFAAAAAAPDRQPLAVSFFVYLTYEISLLISNTYWKTMDDDEDVLLARGHGSRLCFIKLVKI